MSIEKARKQALIAAAAAVVVGATAIVSVALIYMLYGEWLNEFAQRAPNAAANALLVKALKAVCFRAVPGLCVMLMTGGGSMLFYLKKQKEQLPR